MIYALYTLPNKVGGDILDSVYQFVDIMVSRA